MAATTAQPPSKSSKKKAVKAIERTESPAPSAASATEKAGDDSFESPYIKELQKNIRNVNKKITNASKTDSLIAQHPGKSLDDLVAARIINPDQKAQILKKPALQAQLAQFEEQLTQHQKVDEQYRTRATADKAEWEKTLEQSVEKAKADAVAETKEAHQKTLRGHLLLLSQFLRLAASRREEAQEPESDESQAIEGVLFAIYAGDEGAVNSMLKLLEGSDDKIMSVPGEQLQTTYSQVQALAKESKTPVFTEATQPTEEVATDPTIAHATATEIAAEKAPVAQESSTPVEVATNGLANANVSDDAANAVAESQWDNSPSNEMTMSQDWVDVKVPRDSAETETGLTATPAAPSNTQSWADDHPEPTPEVIATPAAPTATPATPATTDPNDGFHQVQRNRPRNEGGNYRGRGRGEWRGRGGFRGEGRGRGRGGRGGSGAPRGRRTEES